MISFQVDNRWYDLVQDWVTPDCVCAASWTRGIAMSWYLEVFDAYGDLISSENGASFENVMDAARACHTGDFGHVRFIGPPDATSEQLRALEEMGARRVA